MMQITKSNNPKLLKITEITSLLSAQWKLLPDSSKRPYEDKAEADQERYKREKLA
jgi:hypothetical protein